MVDAVATAIVRPAAPEERDRMRRLARARGATLRAPWAWLGRVVDDLALCLVTVVFVTGFLGLFALPVALFFLIAAWASDSFWWTTPYDIFLIVFGVVAAGVNGVVVARTLIEHRAPWRALRRDAWPGDMVLVRTVRADAVLHQTYTPVRTPREVRDSLFFRLDGNGVFIVEGPDLRAWRQGKQLDPPDDFVIDGPFPSDHFEIVLAPRSRKTLAIRGLGGRLASREWRSDAPGVQSRAFRERLRENHYATVFGRSLNGIVLPSGSWPERDAPDGKTASSK